MKSIELEDIVSVVCTEFVKQNKDLLQGRKRWDSETESFYYKIPYLKMNYMKRRKISDKLIDKIHEMMDKEKAEMKCLED
jgi:hypothetical protein